MIQHRPARPPIAAVAATIAAGVVAAFLGMAAWRSGSVTMAGLAVAACAAAVVFGVRAKRHRPRPVFEATSPNTEALDDEAAARSTRGPASTRPPTAIGPYVVEAELGRGANSVVYLACEPRSGMRVAIKTLELHSNDADDPDAGELRERFEREAQTAQRLRHPGIVAVYGAGEAGGRAWIAMEHLDGASLERHTALANLLPITTVVRLAAQIADALAHAHEHGIVHRDVKPANVMLDPERRTAKLADFGIARIADASRTRTGMVLGTPSFMAPEQLAGGHVDARSDVYALGVMVFQLLTGRLPFESDSMRELMHLIAHQPAADVRQWRAEVPEALADVVALALEKRPEVRYASASQMAEDLRAVEALLTTNVVPFEDVTPTASGGHTDPRHNPA